MKPDFLNLPPYSPFPNLETETLLLRRINLEDVDESENPLAIEQAHFVIYPNPATEKFVIEGAIYSGIALYDVTGREVKDFQLNPSHEYIISDVARGTYFLRIFTQDAVLLERIVVR